jgi:hypothetical protein
VEGLPLFQHPRKASGLSCTRLAGSPYEGSLSFHCTIPLINQTYRWLSTVIPSLPWENWVLPRSRVYIFSMYTRLASYTMLGQGWPGQ